MKDFNETLCKQQRCSEGMASLDSLPPEILLHIASYITDTAKDVRSLARFSSISKAIYEHIHDSPVLWKKAYISYWVFESAGLRGRSADIYQCNPPQIYNGLKPGLGEGSPRQAFYDRQKFDRDLTEALDNAIKPSRRRFSALKKICAAGMDAADVLNKFWYNAAKDADFEKLLWCHRLRRGISSSLGDRLMKQVAAPSKSVGKKVLGSPEALDTLFALSAYVRHKALLPEYDIRKTIETFAEHILHAWKHESDCEFLTNRSPCQCIRRCEGTAGYDAVLGELNKYGLTNLSPSDYYKIENSFLSTALLDNSPPLPIVLVVIFCAVASKVGCTCWPVSYPGQVLASILYNVDGQQQRAFYSPFENGKVYQYDELTRSMRQNFGITLGEALSQLDVMHGDEIAIRSARNILNSLERHGTGVDSYPELLAGLRALHWAGQPLPLSPSEFAILMGKVDPFNFDAIWMPELNEMERRGQYQAGDAEKIKAVFLEVVERDMACERGPERFKPEKPIRYSIGTIISHKKYDYIGAIFGHDETCLQSDSWKEQMRIDEVEGGSDQPFYHVLRTDHQLMYVAQSNIRVLSCAACGDLETSGEKRSRPLTPALKHAMDLLEQDAEFGLMFRKWKNEGRCGYLPSRDAMFKYPPERWPPNPHACSFAE
jgi:hemimethylated DNA binding protein